MKSMMTAALFVASSALAALAQGTGSEGYFELHNDTEDNVLIGFYTNGGDGWSENWIEGVQIMPGESGTAEFAAETGSCEQTFVASWLGDDGAEIEDDPISIDICEASNVYLGDNEITFD